MERLTEYNTKSTGETQLAGVPNNRIAALFITENEEQKIYDAINKLADYEDAEENGTLIKLPCKVGDTVYGIMRFYKRSKIVKEEVIHLIVDHFTIGDSGVPIMTVCGGANDWYDYDISDAGTGFFFTREDAENALKERESE